MRRAAGRLWVNGLADSRPASGAAPRAAAARALSAVVDHGRSLDVVLPPILASLGAADRSLASMLARETVRWHRLLHARLKPRLKNKRLQPLIHALLEVGVWQLDETRVPPHAAVSATVAATGLLDLGRARGLVNAVLRGHQRAPVNIGPIDPSVQHSLPTWLLDAIRTDWPDETLALLGALNGPPPLWLRNNARAQSRDKLAGQLAARGLATRPSAVASDALCLADPVAADDLPELAAGTASIQDSGAQLAADLVDPAPSDRILDACAAPGNKTAHLLERGAGAILALDIDSARLAYLDDNLKRLGLVADTRVADTTDPKRAWWDGRMFDRILIDAPCSGTGVIRRHPDIKWLRRPGDVQAAAKRQLALLHALWPTLAPGGVLVYATCSVLRAEGVEVVARFMDEQADAADDPIRADWGYDETIGRRIAVGQHGFDGFYYARLKRRLVA